MLVPYYVSIVSPTDCHQGNVTLVPAVSAPPAAAAAPAATTAAAAAAAAAAASNGGDVVPLKGGGVSGLGVGNNVTVINEFVTYANAGVSVPLAQASPSTSMELVWHGEFDRLFSQYYPQAWYLVPTFYAPSDRWQVFKDSAKVRFSCADCGHGWTSMKGRVIFWFHLNFATNAGYVLFKLYGQQCQKCNNGKFEHAMWYPEEVVKVVGNVYNRVGQVYYGFVRPPLRIDRRQGKPRNQHNAELCQACKEGLCKEEWAVAAAS